MRGATGMAATVMVMLATVTCAAEGDPRLCGDANHSGTVTVSDGIQILRSASGLATGCDADRDVCDVQRDGAIGVSDGVRALRAAAELETVKVCGAGAVAGDESLPRAAVTFPGCAAITTESHYCLTLAADFENEDWRLALLGLDSGTICPVQPLDASLGFSDASSLGWRGEVAYVCAYDNDQDLVRISLRDGSWERGNLSCQAVTGDERGLLVQRSPGDPELDILDWFRVFAFESYSALRAHDYGPTYDLPTTSRIAVQGDRIYGAWHSTDTIDVVDRTSGAALGPITLEGYDDWVMGLDVTVDAWLTIANWKSGEESVTVFDARNGSRLREVTVPGMISGLACVARERVVTE